MEARSVRLALAVLTLAAFAAVPSAASAARFKYGVAAGDVSSSSAVLWGRATGKATVKLQVSLSKRFKRSRTKTYRVKARKSHDYTVQRRVKRLKAGRTYWFRFLSGHRKSKKGTFKTAPRRSKNARIRFAWTGDTDFNPAPGQTKPYWNSGGIYRQMRREKNAFNVNLGDTMYSDSEIPGRLNPIALTLKQKWAKYRINLANRFLSGLRGSGVFYSVWDDHEFIDNFSPNQNTFNNGVSINGHTLFRRGAAAFRDYAPVTYSKRNGTYRSFRWGRNLELFLLDERSFRSATADNSGVCDNPQTHQPDYAPTAPPANRAVFGAVLPATGLSQPVNPACLAAIRSSKRTFLGSRQYSRFTKAIKRSTARWKVIINEMPIQQSYAFPYDAWEGYEHERQRLLHFLHDNVKNVIFLTTDVHATLVNDARFQTLEQGGPMNSGIYDFTVGSAATESYAREIDERAGPGAGQLVANGFFKPQPPNGVGMRCAVMDKFSYGEVSVTRSKLSVTPKGIDGKPLSDCAPLVLNHR